MLSSLVDSLLDSLDWDIVGKRMDFALGMSAAGRPGD